MSDASALVDLYLRLSIDREGKDSLERQEADLRKWAANEGLTVRKVWADAGKSGYAANVKRPSFEQALEAIRNREAGTLAVWKLDRLSRRGAGQVGLLLDDVVEAGGRLVFLRDGIDTSTGGNSRMLIVLLSEQARAESANASTRILSSKDKARREGRYLGGSAPFGYIIGEDRKLRPHPDEAPILREAVDRIIDGATLQAVCRDWNDRGIPTRRRGKMWRTSSLSVALRSPTLAGLTPDRANADPDEWGSDTRPWRDPDTGEYVSLMAEGYSPIITESTRQRLLDELRSRVQQWGRTHRALKGHKSLLGGLIRCATCGRTANLFGTSYRCRRWHVNSKEDCRNRLSVTYELVDEAVKRAWAVGLASLEPDSPILAAVAERWIQRFDPAPLREREEVRGQLDDARARLVQADNDHYVRGTLDAERHARITDGLQERMRHLEARLRDLPTPEADLAPLLDPELSLPAIMDAPTLEARALLKLAFQKVVVSPAPKRGARFYPHERVRVQWVGEDILRPLPNFHMPPPRPRGAGRKRTRTPAAIAREAEERAARTTEGAESAARAAVDAGEGDSRGPGDPAKRRPPLAAR